MPFGIFGQKISTEERDACLDYLSKELPFRNFLSREINRHNEAVDIGETELGNSFSRLYSAACEVQELSSKQISFVPVIADAVRSSFKTFYKDFHSLSTIRAGIQGVPKKERRTREEYVEFLSSRFQKSMQKAHNELLRFIKRLKISREQMADVFNQASQDVDNFDWKTWREFDSAESQAWSVTENNRADRTQANEFPPPIPSNEDLLAFDLEEFERITAELELPFQPLTERFELDDEEQRWTQSDLDEFSNLLPEGIGDEGVAAAEEVCMLSGCYKAAEAKFNHTDFRGAFDSWLKMFALNRLETAYIRKTEWLLLAGILVGLKDSVNAETALIWVNAATAAAPNLVPDEKFGEMLEANWAVKVDEVRRGLEALK